MERQQAIGCYLAPSPVIDFEHPAVLEKALRLSRGSEDDVEAARRCFLFVRDEIRHSGDIRMGPVTLKASEVLEHGTGLCYAKSHLLAALLRANGIPAGLCYQRLARADGRGFCLHGLNAVFLRKHGWFRADPRGNTNGTTAGFDPPMESLPFAPGIEGEADLPEIWDEPLPVVVKALSDRRDLADVLDDLPDVELLR